MTAADDLKDKLLDLANVYDDLMKNRPNEEQNVDNRHDRGDVVIKSHILNYPHRRYYLDLKENQRGHFLRLTMLSTNARVKLGIPAEGIRDLYNAVNDLLKTWWAHPATEQKGTIYLLH